MLLLFETQVHPTHELSACLAPASAEAGQRAQLVDECVVDDAPDPLLEAKGWVGCAMFQVAAQRFAIRWRIKKPSRLRGLLLAPSAGKPCRGLQRES